MKTLTALILVFALALSLTACGGSVSQEEYERVLEELEIVQESNPQGDDIDNGNNNTPPEPPPTPATPQHVDLNLPILTFCDSVIVYHGNTSFPFINAEDILQNQNREWVDSVDSNVRTFVISTNKFTYGNSIGEMYIKNDNSLWGYGSGRDGRLGDGTGLDHESPIKILDDVAYAYHFGGGENNYYRAVKTDKTVWQWGDGINFEPVKIASNAISVYGDVIHSSSGLLYNLSDGSSIEYPVVPVYQYEIAGEWVEYTRTNAHWQNLDYVIYWIDENRILWKDDREQAGLPPKPTMISEDVEKFFLPLYLRMDQKEIIFYVKTDGSLWGLGKNTNGELGDGTKAPQIEEPVKITDSRVIDAGWYYYLTFDGDYWTWDSDNPTPVKTFDNIAAVYNTFSAGYLWREIVTKDGKYGMVNGCNADFIDNIITKIPQVHIFE